MFKKQYEWILFCVLATQFACAPMHNPIAPDLSASEKNEIRQMLIERYRQKFQQQYQDDFFRDMQLVEQRDGSLKYTITLQDSEVFDEPEYFAMFQNRMQTVFAPPHFFCAKTAEQLAQLSALQIQTIHVVLKTSKRTILEKTTTMQLCGA